MFQNAKPIHPRTHDRHGQSVRLSPLMSPAPAVMTYRLVQTRSQRARRLVQTRSHRARTERLDVTSRLSRPLPPVHQPAAHARPVSACARRGSVRRGGRAVGNSQVAPQLGAT
jgi:hypothetical protein